MNTFDPKFVTFDCYGTLTDFQMSRVTTEIIGDRLGSHMEAFLNIFEAYRIDEVMGDWKPYRQIIRDAFRRALRRFELANDEAAADAIYACSGSSTTAPRSVVRPRSRG